MFVFLRRSDAPTNSFRLAIPHENEFRVASVAVFLIGIAGWIKRSQNEAINYLRAENQVRCEVVGKKRILLSDDQWRLGSANGSQPH